MILDPLLDLFRGKAVTIPPLDGAFRPNTALDDATLLSTLADADNLLVAGGRLLATSGAAIVALAGGAAPVVLEHCAAPVSALAVSPVGTLAIGLESGVLRIGQSEVALPAGIGCITALAYDRDGTLWLANGSTEQRPSEWAADLMKKGQSGSLWKCRQDGRDWQRMASGLAFPFGLHMSGKHVLVSESWRHRLIRIDAETGRSETVLAHLPGYPARLSPAGDGGAWLALFAPRNRLIEFVLQETHYRNAMLETVAPEFWVAPALSSGRSFQEPLQCGGIRTMGIHKPWSPSRSYGLLVKLDGDLQPQFSLHSRADGTRHGICSLVEHGGHLVAASRGGGCVVTVPLAAGLRH